MKGAMSAGWLAAFLVAFPTALRAQSLPPNLPLKAGPPLACVPGRALCCADGTPQTVPATRALQPKAAQAALKALGYSRTRLVNRPGDGVPAGTVMASNPLEGTSVCTSTGVVLYVAEATNHKATLRNFHGDTVAQARKHLEGALQKRFTFSACGSDRGSGGGDPRSLLVVNQQWPPEGTPLAQPWPPGMLQLTPRDEFWQAYAGLSLAQARAALKNEPAYAGWRLLGPEGGALESDAIVGARRLVGATGDRSRCEIRLALAIEPNNPGTPDSAIPTAPPNAPGSPVLPAAGGALGALLLARALRGPKDTAFADASTAPAAPTGAPPRLRVRRDLADGNKASAP